MAWEAPSWFKFLRGDQWDFKIQDYLVSNDRYEWWQMLEKLKKKMLREMCQHSKLLCTSVFVFTHPITLQLTYLCVKTHKWFVTWSYNHHLKIDVIGLWCTSVLQVWTLLQRDNPAAEKIYTGDGGPSWLLSPSIWPNAKYGLNLPFCTWITGRGHCDGKLILTFWT